MDIYFPNNIASVCSLYFSFLPFPIPMCKFSTLDPPYHLLVFYVQFSSLCLMAAYKQNAIYLQLRPHVCFFV